MSTLKGNVITGDNLSQRMRGVLDYVATSVAKTLGPNGHNALIQNMDTLFSTKDGWTVLRNIKLENTVDNSIKSMIESVAQSTVLRAGDGSTTSTIAANRLNQIITENIKGNYPIREIEDTLEKCINDIIDKIKSKSMDITEETLGEDIYKIAMVSTNWNKELSQIIADIYVNTHNPIIKVVASGTDKTSVEYIDGYDLAGGLLLPNFYITDADDKSCKVKNPRMLLFDFSINEKWFAPLVSVADVIGTQQGLPVIILAPAFSTGFRDKLIAYNKNAISSKKSPANIIPVTYVNNYATDKDCVDDFMALTGIVPITITNDEVKECFDDLFQIIMNKPIKDASGNDKVITNEDKVIAMQGALAFIDQYAGTCEEIKITKDNILAQGLNGMNVDEVDKRKKLLRSEIDGKTNECDALTMLTDDIRVKRIRLGKLQCKMGIIKVGGYGDANLRAKKDALDDATRACEAAYRSGYVKGSSLSIIEACMDILDLTSISENDEINSDESNLYNLLVFGILSSYLSVFRTLIFNKHEIDAETVSSIVNKCKHDDMVFDVVTETYESKTNIINPTDVDIQSLKACLRLVIITATSAQLVVRSYDGYVDPDVETTSISEVSPVR